ncbi:VPLPA-CTERM sorting domain-containing protein [Pararhodobacter sp. SW119]|uniref:VPLPA-CTERM sorting domain-containing protein n=1 Tax=Pararhodobacter sp. SW119 TaxID=2780075 RepID=UPI001AE00316|nr:VPLPA-CTERM sorting domain-containing protein [Pararhodobacter sp. SW119]
MFDVGRFSQLASAAILALGFGAVGVQASTCDILNFTTSTACYAPVPGGSGGNIDEAEMDALGGDFAGVWELLGKIDRDIAPGVPGTSPWTADTGVFSITDTDDPNKFNWTLNFPYTWDLDPTVKYAFAIKGGAPRSDPETYNAVYLMDKDYTSGMFKDKLEDIAITADWSNVRLFGTSSLTVIPLPATGWLMLGMLGVGAVAANRKRKQKAA